MMQRDRFSLVIAASLAATSCRGRPADSAAAPAGPGRSRPGASTPLRAPAIRLPDTAVPRRQSVDLTIIPDEDTFTGEVVIDIELRRETAVLWLDAKEIEVRDASIEAGGARQVASRTVELAASAEIPSNEMEPLLSGGEADPTLADRVYDEAVQRFAALAGKLGADRRIGLLRIGGALCSQRRRDQADRFFADKLAGAPGIATARDHVREQIDLCVARRAAQSAAVAEALAGT